MKGEKAVTGVFTYLDDTLDAIKLAQDKGLEYRVYAPTYIPEIEEATTETRSKVSMLTATGGIIGCTAGFSLAILAGLDWPLRVSAKDIVAVPSYIVIGYECTILFGAIATLLGLLHFCRLPDIFRKPGYDPRFSCDKFGVVVGCSKNQIDEVESALTSAGAEEVNVETGL